MEGLLAIIALVFGVLNIILFFKIWGMTNNVKLLVKHFTEGTKCKDVGGEIRLAKMRGMPHSQIQEMLVERMSAEIIKEFYSGNGGIGNVTTKWRKIFNNVDVEMPDSLKQIKTAEDVINLYHEKEWDEVLNNKQ